MLIRLVPLTALLAVIMATDSAVAQSAAKASTPPTFQVIAKVYTPDEAPLVESIIDRLRLKFTGDAAFTKSFESAINQRAFGTAANLVANAAQVRAEQIVFGQKKLGAARVNARMIHFASLRYSTPFVTEPRLNPGYFLISTPWVTVCWSATAGECTEALRRLGFVVP